MPRVIDWMAVVIVAPLAIPIALLVSVIVLLDVGRPIFFSQSRGGYAGRTFMLHKFRTMTDLRDARGDLLSDDDRLTSFGKFLRSTSLDELPSLVNLLKGDIRLVGPRPLVADYLPLYSAEQKRRHSVPPGITGWAQVNGRNSLSWEDKFLLDIWYVENQSMMLDIKIIALTIIKVFRRQDISAAGEATMRAFEGTQDQSITEISDLNRSRK